MHVQNASSCVNVGSDRPLITFALYTYNQERFIREAIYGAFSQTYTPLEIIISDDCSADQTFAVVKEMVAGYKGPHQVRVNRNTRNLGIGGHTDKMMMELVRGELIVCAAGDDISAPERVETIYQAWERSGRKAYYILSGYQRMTIDGKKDRIVRPTDAMMFWTETIAGYIKKNRPMIAPGCVQACHKDVFAVFGPITLAPSIEDNSITLRAMLLGKVLLLPDVLVYWRMSGAVSLVKDPLFMWRQDICYRSQSLLQLLADFRILTKGSFLERAYARYVCKASLLLAHKDSLGLRSLGWLLLVPVCRPTDSFHNFKLIHRRLGSFSIRRFLKLPVE